MASAPACPAAIATWPRGMRERLQHEARGRLPQPVADLVVEGRVLVAGEDVGVIAQAVEELRAVGLGVDRLQLDALDELAPLRARPPWG